MNKIYTLTSVLLCSLVLGGCNSFRNTFGLDHYSPDEMGTSGPNPSLILPPDFAQRPKLPPPTPGTSNPHEISSSVKAQKTVLGDTPPVETFASLTKGEKDVIQKASENQVVTDNIRGKLEEESQSENDGTISGKVISKIQSWKKEAADNLTLSKPDKATINDDLPKSDNDPVQSEEQSKL